MKKGAPFKRRNSICKGGYLYFEIDSLARYYENMASVAFFMKKDYSVLKEYIDKRMPVLVNVKYSGSSSGLVPGRRGHWMVLRGITDTHVWVNDPGRSAQRREWADNRCYPIKKEQGNLSFFDGCWTGKYIVIAPKEWNTLDSGVIIGLLQECLPAGMMLETAKLRPIPPDVLSLPGKIGNKINKYK